MKKKSNPFPKKDTNGLGTYTFSKPTYCNTAQVDKCNILNALNMNFINTSNIRTKTSFSKSDFGRLKHTLQCKLKTFNVLY